MDDSTTSLTSRLTDLSRNLWWTWHPEVVAIFRDVEPALWREVNHNPIAFVKRLTPEQWSRHAEETVIEIRVNRAFRRLEKYLRESGTWASRFCNVLKAQPVVYFSAEFALHESLPTYSEASASRGSPEELLRPRRSFCRVGIFYGQGYFRQGFDINGWQQESYGHIDVEQLPLSAGVTAADGRPVVIEIPLDGGSRDASAHGAPTSAARRCFSSIPTGRETLATAVSSRRSSTTVEISGCGFGRSCCSVSGASAC